MNSLWAETKRERENKHKAFCQETPGRGSVYGYIAVFCTFGKNIGDGFCELVAVFFFKLNYHKRKEVFCISLELVVFSGLSHKKDQEGTLV